MRRTNTYQLENFETGSFYYASSDYRRFTTLDYNLKTYIGLVGNGVLRGWDIKQLSSRTIKISPGCGFISGLYTESPWIIDPATKEPKRKSKAVIDGDDIFEEIPGWSSQGANDWVGGFYNIGGSRTYDVLVFDKLGPDGEDNNFDGVIDGVLQPHYKEPPDDYFTNPFVKAISTYLTTFYLEDDTDNYIFAEKVSMNPNEVFANFFVSQNDVSNEDNLLLATISVRDGSILKISYDGVLRAKALESATETITKQLLKQHIHGGSENWDPPRIKLETDIRECFFVGINNNSNIFRLETEDADFINGCVFAILSSNETEQTEDVNHSHYYEMDSDGNGFTHYIYSTEPILSKNFHYHTILTSTVAGETVTSLTLVGSSDVVPHTHTVNKTSDIENFDDIVVRINNKVINAKYYKTFVKNGVSFVVLKNNLSSFKNGQYISEFGLIDNSTYSFQKESNNIARFVYDMMADFNNKFQHETSYTSLDGTSKKITIRTPFTFQTNTTSANLENGESNYILADPTPVNVWPAGANGSVFKFLSAKTDLFIQSIVVTRNLTSNDNEAMFFPNVARFTTVTALEATKSEEVKIEILKNVEVTKWLSSKNIFFIDAENFKKGMFLPEYIPFINHIEYFSRNFALYQFNTFSNDSSDFRIVPILASSNKDHYHKVWVDKYGNGKTSGTYIDDQIVVSETVQITVDTVVTEETVLVEHIHEIKNGIVMGAVSAGLNQYNSDVASLSHNHHLIKTPNNNSTSVFYVGDDKNGNIFLGTSNGLLNKPTNKGYEITIEGNAYYYEVGDLQISLLKATYQNFLCTQRYALFSSAFVQALPTIVVGSEVAIPAIFVFSEEEATLNTDGTTTIKDSKVSIESNIIVKIVDIFPTSDFNRIKSSTYEMYDAEDEEILYEKADETITTKVDFHKQSIWSGCLLDDGSKFFISQKKIIRSVVNEQGEYWEEIIITTNPFNIARKIIKNGNYFLVCGDNGVKTSTIINPSSFVDTSLDLDAYDMIQSSSNVVLATTKNGLYKTSDNGFTWDVVLTTANLKEITRDYALDKTTIEDGHFHYLMTDVNGDGYTSDPYLESGSPYPIQHIHEVSSWTIKNNLDHNHDIISTLFFRTDANKIFKSIDSGSNWVDITDIPSQYSVETIFTAFGYLFVGTFDKLIYYDGTEWIETSVINRVFSFNWLHNLNGFYIGCDNKVYVSYDGIVITEHISFDEDLLPICFVDQQETNNGFVYNNLNQSINFKNILSISALVTTSQNYDLLLSKKLDASVPYNIVINNSTVLSTKDDIDNREASGFNFDFNTKTGLIDFGAKTTLSSNINYGDEEINIESSVGFEVGKEIIIYKTEEFKLTGLVGTTEKYFWQKEIKRKITSVSTGTITTDIPIYDNIDVASNVRQIYKLIEEPDVVAVYYETAQIINIGVKTHEEIEDSLSNKSIDMPFKLSEVLLNNFNQLSLYTKYGLPAIDDNFKNWQSFFMRYDRGLTDENYIGKFFDITQSNLQNSSILTGIFNPLLSSSINKVYFGRNDYKEMVFAGTNNGLYATIPNDNFNNNWFLVPSNVFGSIYDIMSLNNYNVLVLSEKGAFVNQDSAMTDWQPLSDAISGSAFFIKYRWINYGDTESNDWWSQWFYEENIKDIDLTNSFILGGKNFVAISNNNGDSWTTSLLKDNNGKYFTNYNATTFLSLSIGSALLVLNNVSQEGCSLRNSILETNGIGDEWNNEIFSFPGYVLVITKVETTEQNNTKITYDLKTKIFISENSLVGLSVFVGNQKTSIVSNSWDNIVLRGTGISLKENDEIKINPNRINSLVETKDDALIMGTESGLFYDKNTYTNRDQIVGTINGAGKEAMVMAIDVSGFIASVSESSAFTERTAQEISTTNIVCILDKNVDTNELVGKKFQFLNEIVPVISIVSPLPNASIASTTVTINLSISMFDVKSSGFVAMQLDGGTIQYSNSTSFTVDNLAYGKHKVTVFLTDINKNKLTNAFSERSIYFTNKTSGQEPYIVVEYPTSQAIIKSASFYAKIKIYNFNTFFEGSLAYSVDDGDIVVEPYQSGNTYNILFDTLDVGDHSIEFMLLDTNEEEIGANQTIKFSLSSNYPSIFISSPTNNSLITFKDINLTYNITNFYVPSNGQVKITLTNTTTKQTYYSTDSLSYQLIGLIDGSNKITVQLVDNDLKDIVGDFTSCTFIINVNTALISTPSLAIFTPSDGSIIKTGTATPIYFTIANFDIPAEGGVLIYINDAIQTFWAKTDPYLFTPVADGNYVIRAILAKSSTEKLTNSQATAQITLVSQDITVVTVDSSATETTIPATTPTTPTTTATPSEAEAATPEQTAYTGTISYFTIISNSASSASGLTLMKIGGNVGQDYVNMYFKIFGDSSTLYVEYMAQVKDHEFDGGRAYVAGSQQNNVYNNYTIKSQVGNKIELVETIDINATQTKLDVTPSQTILLIPSGNEMNLWMNLDKSYGQNEFANLLVYFDGVPEVPMRVVNNTQRSIALDTNIDPSRIEQGTALRLGSVNFSPLKTFNNRGTGSENNHYHKVKLIDGFLSGSIESINKLNTGYIVAYVKNTVGFDNPIIATNPDLLKGAVITFYPSSNSITTLYDVVDSVYVDRIIIKTENPDIYNIDHAKPFGVDATYLFNINAKYYGETTITYFEDFSTYKTQITQDALSQQSYVSVDDSDMFKENDQIRILNNKEIVFYSTIKSIVDGKTLELGDNLNYSFLVVDDSCIVIYETGASGEEYNSETSSETSSESSAGRLDAFDHTHLVRNCEISLTTIDAFDQVGYPRTHDHGLSNLIGSVKNIIKQSDNGRLMVGGTDDIVWFSDDSGDSWNELINVKDYISEDVFGDNIYITSLDIDSDKDLVIGTNVGVIVRQGLDTIPDMALLSYPFTDQYLPSSSSSSSSSSESSYSSESTSSSISSFSTSTSSEIRSSSSSISP